MTATQITDLAREYALRYWQAEAEQINMAEAIGYTMENYVDGFVKADDYWRHKTKWISVEIKLPEIDHFVLWKTEEENHFVTELDKDMDFEWFRKRTKVTHWKEIE